MPRGWMILVSAALLWAVVLAVVWLVISVGF